MAGKSKKIVKVAIIGAGGRAASAHYPCLHEIPDCELVAACDLNAERLGPVCDRFGIAGRYTNYQEMIEKETPDLVYTIMPPHHLYDVTANVIEMGCHVVIEKPPALTSEQVRQMAILARRKNVLTGVTFQRRFSPLLRQGKSWCQDKGGNVHTAHASFYKNWVGGAPYYKGAIDMLTSDGIHAVDTLRWMCGGDVVSVAADSRRLDAEHFNMHLALVRFSSGATGVLLNNFMAGRRIFAVEIHSPGVTFFGDPEEGGRLFADNQLDPVETLDPFVMADSDQAHRAFGPWEMNMHFLDCVREGRQPETCFDDALKTMELVDAVYGGQI